jgi:hypothetical protein
VEEIKGEQRIGGVGICVDISVQNSEKKREK